MVDAPPSSMSRTAVLQDRPSAELLGVAREHDHASQLAEAAEVYAAAVGAAEREGAHAIHAEALRRLGIVQQRRQDPVTARQLCRQSYDVAVAIGDDVLAAEALNTLACFDLEGSAIDGAREQFHRALELGGSDAALRARIEQNLGILAMIQGDLSDALGHYQRSLDAFHASGDERGCAIAYNNLGMVSADQKRWTDADRYFRQSLLAAEAIGDVHLRGAALLNHTEVFLAERRYEEARQNAEAALRIFDQLGARRYKSDAYRFLGVGYRETGRASLAEARLRMAIDLASDAGAILEEAEATRELARLYQDQGRNQDALKLLNASHRLFRRLDARLDLVDVSSKVDELEAVYLAVVRDWGQSIESADSYTFGHCGRVADYAVGVARGLGFDDGELTTIRLGAYLHDVGKVRIPHEILNKPGRLTPEEFEVMKMHPVYGIELLASIEFPWDIKPMIRWHHEKIDGKGYPDGLRGDEIPLSAQIICVADVYDALTTTRSYRGAMTRQQALDEMRACQHWWRRDVYDAFLASLS